MFGSMIKNLVGRMGAKEFFLAAFLGLVATNSALGVITATRSKSGGRQLSLPAYGDTSKWGRYFRQLQDTTATSWYKEIIYYSYRSAFSRGVVTARFTITPDGRFHNPQILSNTSNEPMANAVVRAIRKTWKQPFPAEVVTLAPTGLVIVQTFRYWAYDPTNYGWASSYPQLLVRRNPEIGGAYNLDIRKYFDLTRFRYQSRIIQAVPAGRSGVALR
jgi:TonB-like protein